MSIIRGIIEDNIDPTMMGRVKVRVFGVHTRFNEKSSEEFSTVSTEDLPWAEVCLGSPIGLISGIGISAILKKGTRVRVEFEDDDPNRVVVVGVFTGTNSGSSEGVYDSGEGFCDPDGVFPLADRSTEPDINELARGTIANTVIAKKNSALDESGTPYVEKAQAPSSYPNSTVFESQSGHIIELDDTPGAERMQFIDRNGNYLEMKLGEMIEKAVQDKVNLVVGNLLEHVGGNQTRVVDGNIEDTVGGTETHNVSGHWHVKAPTLSLGESGLEPMVLGDKLAAWAAKLANWCDTHQHTGNLGAPTSVALVPHTPDAEPAVFSGGNVYSTKNKTQ